MHRVVIDRQRQKARYFTETLSRDASLDVVLIRDGRFQMGSPEDEPERFADESPQHFVDVPLFFLGKYPITQAQWRAVAAFDQVDRPLDLDPSHFKGNDRPVERVSWHDAIEFCARLSHHAGRFYRLPSEAEWEYACRAGTTTPFHFGETIATDLANCDGNYIYDRGEQGVYRNETTPVGSFGVANAFGLFDMHGNVWEWCADQWHKNYEGAPIDGSAWLGEKESESRLLRGGSWINGPRNCRSANRFRNAPDDQDVNFGFRVVCSAARTL